MPRNADKDGMGVAILTSGRQRKGSETTMTNRYPRRYATRYDDNESRADRTTIWLLLLVVSALIIALTFSDAHGALGSLL